MSTVQTTCENEQKCLKDNRLLAQRGRENFFIGPMMGKLQKLVKFNKRQK